MTKQPRNDDVRTEHEGVDVLAIWRDVRKYWLMVLAVTLAVSSAITFWTLGQKKIYRSSATVMFDPNPPRPLGAQVEQVVELGTGSLWDMQEYYETQYQLIRSSKVAKETVLDLGLQHDARFLENTPPGDTPRNPNYEVEPDVAADVLRSRLSVAPVKGSRLAKVQLEDADPQRAKHVVETLVNIYVGQNVETASNASSGATDELETQLETLRGELEDSEQALHDYKKEKRLLSVEFTDKSNMLREEMAQLNTALTEVKAKRVEAAARYAQIAAVSSDDPLSLPASEFIHNSLLSSLKSEYQGALRDRDALLGGGKGANHPNVLAATARIDVAKKALLAEVRNIQGAVQRDLAIVSAQEGGLNALFNQTKDEALELNKHEIEYNRRKRTKENNEKLYSMVLQRTKENSVTQEMIFNNISIVEEARAPSLGAPVRPRVPVNIAAGIVIGLLLGVGAAFGRSKLDRTIKTPADVEQRLRANVLGLIPEISEQAEGEKRTRRRRGVAVVEGPELTVHRSPTGGVAEAARAIRTNLMFMSPDDPFKTLLVSSAGPADGKTTVACCIAIAMAQAGRRVLLLDCDLRRPRVHRIFGKSSDVGLTTALLDEHEEVVFETGVDNLSVTVAGPIPPNPAEILQSEKFRHHLEAMQQRFDMVIIDSPPLAAVTDATVLSKMVDGTVLVVRAHKTLIDVAQHGMRHLTDVGSSVAGVVLNAVNLDRDEYRYSYRYYRRGSYYTETNPGSRRSGGGGKPPAHSAGAAPPLA